MILELWVSLIQDFLRPREWTWFQSAFQNAPEVDVAFIMCVEKIPQKTFNCSYQHSLHTSAYIIKIRKSTRSSQQSLGKQIVHQNRNKELWFPEQSKFDHFVFQIGAQRCHRAQDSCWTEVDEETVNSWVVLQWVSTPTRWSFGLQWKIPEIEQEWEVCEWLRRSLSAGLQKVVL